MKKFLLTALLLAVVLGGTMTTAETSTTDEGTISTEETTTGTETENTSEGEYDVMPMDILCEPGDCWGV